MSDDCGVVLPGPETDRVDCPTKSMHKVFDHTGSDTIPIESARTNGPAHQFRPTKCLRPLAGVRSSH
jgi:hypothetical protein